MEANKILSANILDLIFDDRNKEYGAYELRATYPERVKKSLLAVFLIIAIAIAGAALANSLKPEPGKGPVPTIVVIHEIPLQEKQPIPPPEEKKSAPIQAETEKLTDQIKMVKGKYVVPLATQEDFKTADVGAFKNDGPEDIGLAKPGDIDDKKGIIPTKENDVSDEPFRSVEVDAKFNGKWERFLVNNLNSNVPVDNGAPAGVYKVIIQFVVDLEGNVSDIKALTNHGYGMEQEAVRVLKKATKWIPANQNGRAVKAYRVQPITFEVMTEQ